MAKKKEGKDIKNQIMSALSSNIIPYLKVGVRGLIKKAQDAVYHTQKKVIENFLVISILLFGFILLTMGVVFFINDYFVLDRYWGFLIVGLILLLVAYFFRKQIEKTKYCRMD